MENVLHDLTKELDKFCQDNDIEKGKTGYLLGLYMKYARSVTGNLQQPDVIKMFMDFCHSMECDGIHNQSLGIKEGVEKYLKSINFL